MIGQAHSELSGGELSLPKRLVHWCHAPSLARARKRGSKLLRQERTLENEPFLRWAVRRYPADPDLRLLYGMTVCTTDPEVACLQVQTALAMDSTDIGRLAMAALAMYHAGNLALADECCERSEEVPWRVDDLVFASDFMNIAGLVAYAEEDYARAEDLLTLAVAADPDSAPFASDLAAFLACVDRTDEARHVVQAAIDRGLDGRHLSVVRADLGV